MREQLLAYWRRRTTFWIVAGAGMAITILVAILWPATYRSSATILIEQQEIPQDLVRSVISTFADQRIQIISQRVMSSQNLLSLIDRYKLYPKVRAKEPREVLLETMRDDINMKMISAGVIDPRSGQPTKATIAFSVSYDSRSRDLALKVANDLASLYLNENFTSRTQRAQQTASFFAEEAARQQARIVALDKELSEFKQAHQHDLPDMVQVNVQAVQRLEIDIRDAQIRIESLESQKVLLQAQLAQISPNSQVYSDNGQRVFGAEDQLKNLRSRLASLKGRYGPEHPDVITTEREIEGLQREVATHDSTADRLRQLNDARTRLAAAVQKYSPEHPDVIRLRREVAVLEKAVSEDPGGQIGESEQRHADNPAYIQVKGQLDAVNVNREGETKKLEALRAKLADYESRMSKSPEAERQYREITRNLESAQAKYQEILSKQTEAQVAQNLESEQKGEKFTMIEAPQPPEKPHSPNRTLILGLGLVLSLALGFAAIVLRESLDSTVRGPADIRDLLQVSALASIPRMITNAERAYRRRVARYALGGAAAALVAAVGAIHFLVMPLDVALVTLLRRFGV